MSPGLAAVALALVVGAVVAMSARDGRLAVVGLLATLALAPMVASPLPDLASAGARIAAATLTAYVVGLPLRERPATLGSRLGWPAEALAAGAAFLAGVAAHDAALQGVGPAVATGAGSALLALAAGPLLARIDVVRQGVGMIAGLTGAELVRTGLDGTPTGLETIAVSVAILAVAAAVALRAAPDRRPGPVAGAGAHTVRRP